VFSVLPEIIAIKEAKSIAYGMLMEDLTID
jgi:hypothetical protein